MERSNSAVQTATQQNSSSGAAHEGRKDPIPVLPRDMVPDTRYQRRVEREEAKRYDL